MEGQDMQIGFPIYLTRLLSSILCGLSIVSLFYVEYCLYSLSHNCTLNISYPVLGDWLFAKGAVFLAGVFVIGELFAGLAESSVFDPIFNNIRGRKSGENEEILEIVHPDHVNCFRYIFPFFCDIRKNIEEHTKKIEFEYFIAFPKEARVAFSLSEMYFNIHRILGGIYVFLWLASVSYTLNLLNCLKFFFHSNRTSWVDLVFVVVNFLLVIFVASQAYKQRMFANHLIYYSSEKVKNKIQNEENTCFDANQN